MQRAQPPPRKKCVSSLAGPKPGARRPYPSGQRFVDKQSSARQDRTRPNTDQHRHPDRGKSRPEPAVPSAPTAPSRANRAAATPQSAQVVAPYPTREWSNPDHQSGLCHHLPSPHRGASACYGQHAAPRGRLSSGSRPRPWQSVRQSCLPASRLPMAVQGRF